MITASDVHAKVLVARYDWVVESLARPEVVHLPQVYAEALFIELLDRIPDNIERGRVAELGLSAVYGGSLFGMTILEGDTLVIR